MGKNVISLHGVIYTGRDASMENVEEWTNRRGYQLYWFGGEGTEPNILYLSEPLGFLRNGVLEAVASFVEEIVNEGTSTAREDGSTAYVHKMDMGHCYLRITLEALCNHDWVEREHGDRCCHCGVTRSDVAVVIPQGWDKVEV